MITGIIKAMCLSFAVIGMGVMGMSTANYSAIRLPAYAIEEEQLQHKILEENGISGREWEEIFAQYKKTQIQYECEFKEAYASDVPVDGEYRDLIALLLASCGASAEVLSLTHGKHIKEPCVAGGTFIIVDEAKFDDISRLVRPGMARAAISHLQHSDMLNQRCMDKLLKEKSKEKSATYYAWLRAREKRADLEAAADLSCDELTEFADYYYGRAPQAVPVAWNAVAPSNAQRWRYLLSAECEHMAKNLNYKMNFTWD